MRESVHLPHPVPAVPRADHAAQPEPVIVLLGSGNSRDDQVVTRLQGHAGDALLIEEAPAIPFNGPSFWLVRGISGQNLYERMRIPVEELNEVTLNRHFPAFDVGRTKLVVRAGPSTGDDKSDGEQNDQPAVHISPPAPGFQRHDPTRACPAGT